VSLSKVYIARVSELGSLVVDVGEQTDLQDTLAKSVALSRSALGDRSFLLAMDILKDSIGGVHLI
jgi:hypothetical protein